MAAVFAALTAIFGKVGRGDQQRLRDLHPHRDYPCRTWPDPAGHGRVQSFKSIPVRTYVFLTLSGLATGASWLCYYRALKLGPAAQVAPIDKLSVVLVAVLGVSFLGEHLSVRNWIGVAMITGGAILVATKAVA